MSTEVHLDDYPLATGTNKGAGMAIITDDGADFRSCGVRPGQYVENTTDGSHGEVSDIFMTQAAWERKVPCILSGGTLNEWSVGDTYKIYKTATKDSEISRIHTDRRFGTKVFKPSELNTYGHLHEDEDLDVDGRKVFGPSQPERAKTR